jgi:hypothetical protein
MASESRYDVCLSFAGEHRKFVREVYEALTLHGVECFFDEPHQVELWGQDLAERFDEVFRKEAQFCVACVSQEWVDRTWPAHERRSALARMLEEPGYLLPVRFDDTEVPGLSPTIGYLDGTLLSPEELASLITKKVKRRPRYTYLPPVPNRLFAALRIDPADEDAQLRVLDQGGAFLDALVGLRDDERALVISILGSGCTCTLPDSTHIPLEHLLRQLNWTPERFLTAFRALRRLGEFSVSGMQEQGPGGNLDALDLVLGWEPRTPRAPSGPATDVANAMIREAGYQACGDCHSEALKRLDFSRTSSMLDWNGDEFEILDANSAPPALREHVECLLEDGWSLEITMDHLRFLEPEGIFYEVIPLSDQHDPECVEQARIALELLLRRAAGEEAADEYPEGSRMSDGYRHA